MMVEKGARPFPGLDGGEWLQGRISTADCEGLVTLVAFWDYTQVHCIRSLPHLKQWYERYAHLGLLIVGVHAPEFQFSRNRQNVQRAIYAFDILYPIVLDNDLQIWNAFASRCLPARYLFDPGGHPRYAHCGPGDYARCEGALLSSLRERNRGAMAGGETVPFSPPDDPRAGLHPSTPDLYLGLQRAKIGNQENDLPLSQPHCFSMPQSLEPGTVYLAGVWSRQPESLRYTGASEGHILLRYQAEEVNLVMGAPRPVKVYLTQDAKPLSRTDAGHDVRFRQGHAIVRAYEPRMYQLVRNQAFGSHLLSLSTSERGLQIYAFSFFP